MEKEKLLPPKMQPFLHIPSAESNLKLQDKRTIIAVCYAHERNPLFIVIVNELVRDNQVDTAITTC